MPVCEKCGEAFAISREDERLVMRGMMAPVCDKCQTHAPSFAPLPVVDVVPPKQKAQSYKDNPDPLFGLENIELMKAWFLMPDGSMPRWLARPKRIIKRVEPLAKPKAMRIPVTIVSEGNHSETTTPQVRLQTNIRNFKQRKHPFWIKKIPGFCDGLTGHDKIEVPYKEVLEIKRDSRNTVRVLLTDGRFVKMEFDLPL